MKVVVTGANSFLGKRIIWFGQKEGWEIFGVVRDVPVERNRIKGVRYISLNMSEYSQMGEYLHEADCMISLAWNGTRGCERNCYESQNQSKVDTLTAIKIAVENGCKTVVTAGSQLEYGPHIGKIDERTRCSPNEEYGKQKLELYYRAKEICAESGIRFIEPRYFSLYGPGDYNKTMIMSVLNAMMMNSPCLLTECCQIWDYLFVDDAAEALVKLISSPQAEGVFNFGSGESRELKKYVEEMKRITGSQSELIYGAIPYSDGGSFGIHPDITKLKSVIGTFAKTDFETGIRKTIRSL